MRVPGACVVAVVNVLVSVGLHGLYRVVSRRATYVDDWKTATNS
ncbi:hypothetical protein ABZ876_22370 [Streptomyces sp. NPDC046931]